MPKFACPVCGDPNAFAIWIDDDPPAGCPQDSSWQQGKPPAVKCVTDCHYQMAKAAQRAEWMAVCPEAFDGQGNMKPGGLIKVLCAMPPDSKIIV